MTIARAISRYNDSVDAIVLLTIKIVVSE